MKTDRKSRSRCAPEKKLAGEARSYEGEPYDILLRASLGKLTLGLSPASPGMALFDWLSHFILSPARQADLTARTGRQMVNLMLDAAGRAGFPVLLQDSPCAEIQRKSDPRFAADAWNVMPFSFYARIFQLCETWLDEATTGISGVSKHHERVVNFIVRQIFDFFSPSNYVLSNPEVIAATLQQGGTNFIAGLHNMLEDISRNINKLPPRGAENFVPGQSVAMTPGKVVYRNRLMELIQYTPQTKKVYAEPVLIVPAWIMKYYILDLSPENSLVKYLVKQGHTVFMISWKNPVSEDRNIGLNDYLELGITLALQVIREICPGVKIHATGYCLGGTLLMIAAAAMASSGEDWLKSITLFAAQIDFREPGELSLFIDQSQVSWLEDVMWEKGYLDGAQMAGAFSMLRSNDLVWSRMIHDYLLGKRRPINDLMAWNADTTRLPYRMHSEYLHHLFLNNDLVQGRYRIGRKRIALLDIETPIFAVGTVKDHVSPWRSVYRIHLFTHTDITFVLTNGGHNAGIVSEPGHKGRHYQMDNRPVDARYISPDAWLEKAPRYRGSWWPAWHAWLKNLSTGKEKIAEPVIPGKKKNYPALCPAPGEYVLGK